MNANVVRSIKESTVKEVISRKVVLQEIQSCFQQMTQWILHPDSYAEYSYKAEVLIELLEVTDCGSVGGYDYDNKAAVSGGWGVCSPKENATGYILFDRFLMVLGKYDTKLEPECGHTVKEYANFFRNIQKNMFGK
jgi:hypothetical protein